MRIIPGSIPTKDSLTREYFSVFNNSESAHNSIVSAFSLLNTLYNQSSILEDIVLNEYLSLINTTQGISGNGFLNKGYIVESYTSNDYVDNTFPVDNQLNIDTQNGDLTLPIDHTNTLVVSDIIVEQGSNGSFGNSINGFENSDIKSILGSGDSNLFEYELLTNVFNSSVLKLGITLKLDRDDVANGIYVRTHIVENIKYPIIEDAQISLDGNVWYDAINILNINKGDHYIRFMPQRVRYVRIRFSQDSFYRVNTLFGKKRRYMIGIREISVKQTVYKQSGEYVSKNFSGMGTINRVSFHTSQIDNNDIKYYISANNGTKWAEIKPNTLTALNNIDLGLYGATNIRNIRVKVKMDRGFSPILKLATENIAANTFGKYSLNNRPIISNAYIGKYISCGNETQYMTACNPVNNIDPNLLQDFGCPSQSTISMQTLYWIPYSNNIMDRLVVRLNGSLLRNDGTAYTLVPHENVNHTNIVFLSDTIPSGMLSISYKQYVHDHRDRSGNIIKLDVPSIFVDNTGFSIEGIVYGDPVQISNPVANAQDEDFEIANAFDGDPGTSWKASEREPDEENGYWEITCSLQKDTCVKMYRIAPSYISSDGLGYKLNPSVWELYASTDGINWKLLDSQQKPITFWDGGEPFDFIINYPCAYKHYKIKILGNCENIDLSLQSDRCSIQDISLFTSLNTPLVAGEDFDVLNRTEIEIKESKYNPNWDYLVSYYPAVNITKNIVGYDGFTVLINGITNLVKDSEISFDYYHEDTKALNDIKYYTPISKEYRIELL